MTPRLWFIYLGIFMVFTFIDSVGHQTVEVASPGDINNAVTFQSDEVASGSGFSGLVRQTPAFITSTLPKFVTWNFGFLRGDFQIIQYVMIMLFGGLLMLTWGRDVVGLLRRNV